MDKSKWEYKSFEDCIEKSKKTKQLMTSDYQPDGSYPIISQEASLISGYTDDADYVNHYDCPVIVFGDHTRVLKYVDFDFAVGADGVKILIPNATLNAKFLLNYLTWYKIPNLGYSRHYKLLKDISVPIPPIADQQRIVAELDCLNEMIALKQEQLKEFDKLAQSIFYDMFGDPITNEKGWEMSSYGNEFVIGSGGTPSKSVAEYWEKGDIPWIGSNMCQNCDIYDNDGKYITQRGLDNSSAKVLKKGTVLIALVGATIGKVGLLHKEMATNQNVAYINAWASGVFDPTFVFYHSMKLYQLFLNLGNGGFKMANQGFIKELPIILPPLALQQQFAEKIQAIEAQKELVKKSIAETQHLLDSRMDYFFD